MTTILKAFRELEGRNAGAEPPAAASPHEDRSLRWRPFTRVLLALSAGLLGGGAFLSVRAALKSAPVPTQPRVAPERPSSARLVLAAPAKDEAARDVVEAAGPARGPVAEEEAPWGRVEKKTATAPALAQLAATVLREPPPAPRLESPVAADKGPGAVPRTAPSEARLRASDESPRREASLRPQSPAAPVDREASRSGDLRVQVTSIAYSPNVAERSATLRIGGQAVRLHQGESASGLEVQLILPDSVYLRRGGDIFAVDARR